MSTQAKLSKALIHAWQSGEALDPEFACALAPETDIEAYRVQEEVAQAMGWFPQGRARAWKVGAPSRDAQPTAAPVPDSAVMQAPSTLSFDSVHTFMGVEVELALRLNAPLPTGATPDDVRAAIGDVYITVEICDARARNWKSLPPLFRLADQQMNRALILGEHREGWPHDLAEREVRLEVNGVQAICQYGGHPLGDPLYLLPWLADHAANRHDGGLRAGDLITTGTWTGLYEAQAGDKLRASIDGVGEIRIDIGSV